MESIRSYPLFNWAGNVTPNLEMPNLVGFSWQVRWRCHFYFYFQPQNLISQLCLDGSSQNYVFFKEHQRKERAVDHLRGLAHHHHPSIHWMAKKWQRGKCLYQLLNFIQAKKLQTRTAHMTWDKILLRTILSTWISQSEPLIALVLIQTKSSTVLFVFGCIVINPDFLINTLFSCRFHVTTYCHYAHAYLIINQCENIEVTWSWLLFRLVWMWMKILV